MKKLSLFLIFPAASLVLSLFPTPMPRWVGLAPILLFIAICVYVLQSNKNRGRIKVDTEPFVLEDKLDVTALNSSGAPIEAGTLVVRKPDGSHEPV